jgi:hypothetical protein
MLYWECKRRLALLRQFRVLAFDYFENIEYASWMEGGAPPNMNVKAQKARHDMNRMMGDVVVSFDLLSIPHVVFYQPAPITGGYAQNLDVIVNTFDLYSFQIPSEKVFDCTDAARFNEPSPFWTRWPSSAQANVQRRLAPHALCRFCPEDYRGCRRESLAL